jgi:glycosyltransferase involved in cell wall biosynthesis
MVSATIELMTRNAAARPLERADGVLVSVVVPVYNRAHRIEECVASVYAQDHRPLEVIVVDDGSSDDTPEVLERLASRYAGEEGFSFQSGRQKNAGAPSARNRGFAQSRGEWIQFLDSDDLLLPDKISAGLAVARRKSAEVVYTRAQFMTIDGKKIDRFWGRRLRADSTDYFEFSWQTMCAIYSRSALEKVGEWNESLTISQDWEFCIRVILSGCVIHFEDRVDCLYRCEGNDRIGSGSLIKKDAGRERALWAVFERLDRNRLLDRSLRRRFRSRFLHVLLSYRMHHETDRSMALIQKMGNAGLLLRPMGSILRVFPPGFVAKRVLAFFDSRTEERSRLSVRR